MSQGKHRVGRGQRWPGGGGQLHGELQAVVWTLPLAPGEAGAISNFCEEQNHQLTV